MCVLQGWEWERETLHLLKAVRPNRTAGRPGALAGVGTAPAVTSRLWLRAAGHYAESVRSVKSPRVVAALQPTPNPSGDPRGVGVSKNSGPRLSRESAGVEQELQLVLQTLREARQVLSRVPLQKRP